MSREEEILECVEDVEEITVRWGEESLPYHVHTCAHAHTHHSSHTHWERKTGNTKNNNDAPILKEVQELHCILNWECIVDLILKKKKAVTIHSVYLTGTEQKKWACNEYFVYTEKREVRNTPISIQNE